MDASRRKFFKAGLALLGASVFSHSDAKETKDSVVVAHPSLDISGAVPTLNEAISLMGGRDYAIRYGKDCLVVHGKIETPRDTCEHWKLMLNSKEGELVSYCYDCDYHWFSESSR